MTNESYALRAGLFIIALSVLIVGVTAWLGGTHPHQKPYIVVTTGSVFGLKPASTVFFRGIAAGLVRRIVIDPHDPRKIFVDIDIDATMPVTRGTYARLKLQGVTGLTTLELDTTADLQTLPTSRAAPGHIPMRPSLIDELGRAGRKTLHRLSALAHALHQTLNATNRHQIQMILAHAAAASRQWTAITTHLNRAVRALPPLERQAQATLTQLDAVSAQIQDLGTRLTALSRNAQGASQEVLVRTLPKINHALDALTAASADVQKLSRTLRHHPRELLLGTRTRPPGPGEPGYSGGP
ncbi:MAG: MlaD family protein [Acidiferrobacter sp.]